MLRISGQSRGRRFAIASVAVAAAATATSVLASTNNARAYPTWTPNSAELTTTAAVTQSEAWLTSAAATSGHARMPAVVSAVRQDVLTARPDDVTSPSSWPTDTEAVAYIATTRSTAESWIDNSNAPDDRHVVVERLIGHFILTLTGPPGTSPTQRGTVLTIAVDPATGQILDVALSPTLDGAQHMPAGRSLFHR